MKIAASVYLLLIAAEKLTAGCVTLFSGSMIPLSVTAGALVLGAGAAAAAALMLSGRAGTRLAGLFFVVQILLTLSSIFYMALAVPVDITLQDTAVTGNFFEVLVAAVFLFMMVRQKKYIRIRTSREEEPRVVAATTHRDEDILPVDTLERPGREAPGERKKYVSVKDRPSGPSPKRR